MASETAHENTLALDFLGLKSGDTVLEVGCGHGRTLNSAVSRGGNICATGIDFSDVMLRAARRCNHTRIATGQARLDKGNSAVLPYGDASFTAAPGVHTLYFWSTPETHLGELHRVLVPGGRLVLGHRPSDAPGFADSAPAEVYHGRTISEVETFVSTCGFANVATKSERSGTRLTAFSIAEKPGPW